MQLTSKYTQKFEKVTNFDSKSLPGEGTFYNVFINRQSQNYPILINIFLLERYFEERGHYVA